MNALLFPIVIDIREKENKNIIKDEKRTNLSMSDDGRVVKASD